MAQPARSGVGLGDVMGWMDRQRLELEQLARNAAAARLGLPPPSTAARPSSPAAAADGASSSAAPRIGPVPGVWRGDGQSSTLGAAQSPPSGLAARYGSLAAAQPDPDDMAALRRRQAAVRSVNQAEAQRDCWMAIPALAPWAVLAGLEGAGAITARLAGQALEQDPFSFVERDPYLRVGDNWATRIGRLAHKDIELRAAAKPGWDYEPRVPNPAGRPLKPDLGTPQRNPGDPAQRYYLELKPDTLSGRRAAAKAVRTYQDVTGKKARAIYYDPEDYQ
jgi:hypothetical protein